jgi:hypothetical protein
MECERDEAFCEMKSKNILPTLFNAVVFRRFQPPLLLLLFNGM